MRKYGFLVFFLGLLLIGGGLTAISQAGGLADVLPYLQTSNDTAASTAYAEPWQAEQLFLLVGFLVVNMVGIGATIAGLMWILHRGVKASTAEAEAEE